MYMISYVDRTNISMALPSLSRELRIDPAQAGNVVGVFFWGYLLLQIPAGYVANSWSAKRSISVLLVAWGACAIGCGLVRTWQQLWVMRLLLGLAEGGVWPIILIFLSHWFPRQERARANALWMLCLPFAVILSSPFSGWILDRWNWRVMMVAEGALPLLWLAVWQAVIYDRPREAKWISDAEREYLEKALEREAADDAPLHSRLFLGELVAPQILLLTLICFLRNIADFGFLVWLPSAIENAKKLTNTAVGGLVTVPFFVAIASLVLNGWHSDKSGERRRHIIVAFAIGGASLLGGVLLIQRSPILAFLCVCLTPVGTNGILGPFWAIPTESLARKVAGPAMGLINSVGNLGGFFGALAVGYLNKHMGGFRYGFGLIGLDLLVAASLSFGLKSARRVALTPGEPDVANLRGSTVTSRET
jgi:MFS family permease